MQNDPKFKHDCESCEFFGHVGGADLYVHKGEPGYMTVLVARFSDEPSDNATMDAKLALSLQGTRVGWETIAKEYTAHIGVETSCTSPEKGES